MHGTAGAANGAIAAGSAGKFSLLNGERRCAMREKFSMWKVMLAEQDIAGDDIHYGEGRNNMDLRSSVFPQVDNKKGMADGISRPCFSTVFGT